MAITSRRSQITAWLPAVAWAGLIFLLSAQPKETFVRLGLSGELLSYGAHLVVYAVLMLLLVAALRQGGARSTGRIYLIAFALTALYGLSDETHQSFVPGRTATLIDWFVDLVGAALTWILLKRAGR